jgi:pimeloyl-ACP methyl ester carboxylesterase
MPLPVGHRLDHYEILGSLGSGGMGEVYRARDTRLDREVAIKVLSGDWAADPSRVERFAREARILGSLEHEHIAAVYGFHGEADPPYLAMELVDGEPLDALIPEGGLALDKLLAIGIPLADAIAHAHRQGVIHRDLKPGNIMVDGRGGVRVLDFGLGKRVGATAGDDALTQALDSGLTVEGQILGTPAYMAPEQLNGEPVDARADVFALGVLLHELATGERPFGGDSVASTISSILRDEPPALTAVRPDLPPDLARVLRRCLEKSPERRLQTATDLRNELEDLRAGIRTVYPAADTGPGAPVEEWVTLTLEMVRDLSDPIPRMVGDTMTYLDNRRESGELVVLVHGIGLDQRMFLPVLEQCSRRAVSVSLYGFGPEARMRPAIPFADHNRLLVSCIREIRRRIPHETLVILAHSAGADQMVRILGAEEASELRPDALVLMGPIVRESSGSLVTTAYSQLSSEPEALLRTLKDLSARSDRLDQWVWAHHYLIEFYEKFGTDVEGLRMFARGLLDTVDDEVFFTNLGRILERVPVVRLLFADDEQVDADHVVKRQLRESVLGKAFREDMVVSQAARRHTMLAAPETVIPVIDDVVGRL